MLRCFSFSKNLLPLLFCTHTLTLVACRISFRIRCFKLGIRWNFCFRKHRFNYMLKQNIIPKCLIIKKSWMKIFGLLSSQFFFFFFPFLSLEWQWAGDTSLLTIWNCNLTNKWTCKCSCKCLSGADFKAWSWNILRFKAPQGLTGLAVTLRKEEIVTAWPQDTQQSPKKPLCHQGSCWNVPVAVEVFADHHMCCFGPAGFPLPPPATFSTPWQMLAAPSNSFHVSFSKPSGLRFHIQKVSYLTVVLEGPLGHQSHCPRSLNGLWRSWKSLLRAGLRWALIKPRDKLFLCSWWSMLKELPVLCDTNPKER